MTPTNGERLAVLETKVDSIEDRVERLDVKVDALDAKLDQVLLRLAEKSETGSDGLTVSTKALAVVVPLLSALGAGLFKLAVMVLGS